MADDPIPTRSFEPDDATTPAAGGSPRAVHAPAAEPGATTPSASLHPGGAVARDRIPGYELLDELGRGGMGVVYRARQLSVNRVVALKVISTGEAARPVELARFQVEAEAVGAIQHPDVVQLYDYGEAAGLRYLALEYVAGGTLAERMRVARFKPREAAAFVARLAGAVHAAHGKGVLHRDLKPANVLLTEAGEPKVTDFGLARVGGSDLTQTGAVMGTPSYMSPEQAAGDVRAVGTRSDVWALGAILYESLAGRPPFRGYTANAVIQAVIHLTPTPPRHLNTRVPRDLETVCLKCLQKDPADRYPSADALAADLKAFLGGFPVAARPVGVVRRAWKWVRRHPARAGILITLFAAGLAAGMLFPRHQPPAITTRHGMWVERDMDAEALFKDNAQDVRVFKYGGQSIDFWIDHEVDGAVVPESPLKPLTAHDWSPSALAELGPDPQVAGTFIWERGFVAVDGTATWKLSSIRAKGIEVASGGTVANSIVAVWRIQTHQRSIRSIAGATYTKLAVRPPGDLRFFGTRELADFPNPIPADRPVCLLEMIGADADADAPTKYRTQTRSRVMCRVVDDTPKK